MISNGSSGTLPVVLLLLLLLFVWGGEVLLADAAGFELLLTATLTGSEYISLHSLCLANEQLLRTLNSYFPSAGFTT
ncbi:hypothetical protein RAD16_41300, partial [Bradyrhizobium sp. 18BD]